MQCQNHLKQLALATHNYHDSFDALPPAQVYVRAVDETRLGNIQYTQQWSTTLALAPFMEMTPVYSAITGFDNTSAANPYPTETIRPHWGWMPTPTSMALQANYSVLQCPSDGNVMNPLNNGYTGNARKRVFHTNYMSARGDSIHDQRAMYSNVTFPSGDGRRELASARSFFASGDPSKSNLGHNFGAILDGTSNTIAWSESATSPGKGSRTIKGNVGKSANPSPDRGGLGGPIASCGIAALADPADRTQFRADLLPAETNSFVATSGIMDMRGRRAFDGRIGFTGFSTVFPPNHPACLASQTWAEEAFGVLPPSSYHTGGVVCALGDGSGRFISDNVDVGTQSAALAPTASDQSPYGVWGGFGSIAGSEAKG